MTDERLEPVLILHPKGRLDADSCGDLRQQLAAAFAAGVGVVGVDLSAVTFLDQAGIDLLTGASRHLGKQSGALVVTRASPEVTSVLRIHDVAHLLQIKAPSLRVLKGTGNGGPPGRPRRLAAVSADGLKRPS